MPLPEITRRIAEQSLDAFLRQQSGTEREHLCLSYSVENSAVTLFERRSLDEGHATPVPVVQLRFDERSGNWSLFRAADAGSWYRDEEVPATRHFAALIAQIRAAPDSIIWG